MKKIDYKTLPKDKVGEPRFDGYFAPILDQMTDDEEYSRYTIAKAIANKVPLPKSMDLNKQKTNVGFAFSYLNCANLITKSNNRYHYQITKAGKDLFDSLGYKIDQKIVVSQPAYIQHQKEIEIKKKEKLEDNQKKKLQTINNNLQEITRLVKETMQLLNQEDYNEDHTQDSDN